ncbi:MAG: NAD(P)H-hydrate dehydratase [Candidatus Omnitrophica bacterium]|nr:NAD(P)H-hydrate dehydratase [Candidatus Omnitrophota bacterium]
MDIIQEIFKKWPPRKKKSHKGDFGRVLIVAGSQGMTGAAELASLAALRTGAGLVSLAVPEAVYSIVARRVRADVMVHPFASTSAGTFSLKCLKPLKKMISAQTILALGPGLSQHPETQKLVRKLIRETPIPVVLDADGLNAFAGHKRELQDLSGRAVLTPHPGEFKRLFGGKLSAGESDRKKCAFEIAQQGPWVIVLKGWHTIVAKKNKLYVNMTGNPGMAKGGFGDVLTGMIAALAAQGFSLWDSARFGVFLHGLVADQAIRKTGEASLMASDLLDYLPVIIKQVRRC